MPLVRLPFRIGTAVLSESSQKFLDSQKLGPQEKTCKKKKIVVRASTYAVGSMSATDASEKQVQRDDSAMHVTCVVSEKSQLITKVK
jgi:hypothetical protein